MGVAEDEMTFTFKIREDAAWSDGKPITSADIQFYYDVILNPQNLTSLFRVSLKRFERPVAVDDKTVVLRPIQSTGTISIRQEIWWHYHPMLGKEKISTN